MEEKINAAKKLLNRAVDVVDSLVLAAIALGTLILAIQMWAAAGFKDTLLRWSMKLEVFYGNEKAIQPGVQGRGCKAGIRTGWGCQSGSTRLGCWGDGLRRWMRELMQDPQQAFPGKGVMKPE